ncbi:MAG: protein translocase subunit SecF [Actinobacteria bacterium]|uniref:Protein translocase subunit SecF n=1 Tax=freshwater metagenome TaxID=449393 RepID=A0A6J7NZL5_9ZZZZ|nr:protein translocase subunit SecF [Actinomycetota bacterium]
MKTRFAGLGRLYRGETTFDFIGRRMIGFAVSLVIVVAGAGSLLIQGLELGIDFRGGVAWEVPSNSTTGELTNEDARAVLDANNIESTSAKIQFLTGTELQIMRVQVGDQTEQTRLAVQKSFADLAKVPVEEVSVASVSSSWGRSITEKALRALIVFFIVVSLYISWRLEWKMALTAIIAMAHDVVISVGVYSLLGFEVTPATVIAFLTILGFSLYDTVVVFDRVLENSKKFAASRQSFANIANISTNEVLARSLNTTLASALPVVSLLVVGSFILGAKSLEDFAVALLVGMLAGTYSSIFVAVPLLDIFKQNEPKYKPLKGQIAVGAAMSELMGHGDIARLAVTKSSRSSSSVATETSSVSNAELIAQAEQRATSVLTHPPRPRKKRR